MSDRRPDAELRPPPNRDVAPQLRARVLNEATRGDRRPSRPPSRFGPIVAGLAAAAVVVGIVYSLSREGEGRTPATNDSPTGQLVGLHDSFETVVKVIPTDKIKPIQQRCKEAASVDAGRRMTTLRLHSPIGRIEAGAYADSDSAEHTQIFCTPFAVAMSLPPLNLVTAQTPVKLVAGTRVQGLLPMRGDSAREAYYDGAWFATAAGVEKIEARIVIDGEEQTWHAATGVNAYVFASTWAPLRKAQETAEVTVQYRAISDDGTLMPMPRSVESSSVRPADTPRLSDRPDVFPPIEQ
jgi:hypothetical protein